MPKKKERERAELQTVDIPGVEVFEAGTHIDSQGRTFTVTIAELQELVRDHVELVKRNFRTPVALTHDLKHKLLAGMPSLGWGHENVRMVGTKLVSDLKRVPVLFADIIKAGGYDAISAGLAVNKRVGDYVAKLALHHIAVLGVQHPAVKSISRLSDVLKLYGVSEPTGEDEGLLLVYEEFGNEADEILVSCGFAEGSDTDKENDKDTEPGDEDMPEAKLYGCASEAELTAKLAKADKLDGLTAELKTEKEKNVTLSETNETLTGKIGEQTKAFAEGKVEAFIETHRKKFKPSHDAKLSPVLLMLAESDEVFEFTEGKTKTTETPLEILGALFADAPELKILKEEGKDDSGEKDEDKGKGKDGDDEETTTDGIPVDDVKLAEKQVELAAKLVKEEGMSESDAFGEALVRLTEAA